jgi:hypothetical protein
MFLLRCNGYKVCTNKTCRHIVPHNDIQTNQCDPGSCCYMGRTTNIQKKFGVIIKVKVVVSKMIVRNEIKKYILAVIINTLYS